MNDKKNELKENNNFPVVPPMYTFALGGLGEVGKNMYVICQGNEVWIVDSGIKFTSELSVEGVIPSFEWLEKNQKRIKGLIVTHGHEDHIGSIPHLLYKIKIPVIYAGRIAANLIWLKLAERKIEKPKLEIINNKKYIKTLNFKITFFNVNHSIPDSLGVCFKSKHGSIVTTGDFKFDFSPVGVRSDLYRMAEYGKNGITLLMADSTNSAIETFSTSESLVSRKINEIVSKTKGRVLIATFASNVFRVREIIKIALKNNRKILILGYSMDKIVNISRKIKYVNVDDNLFVDGKNAQKIDDNKLLILSTGTQGEPLAALSKLADDIHKDIKLRKEDTIIFASSAIPGNYEAVEKMTNKLIKKGCTIYNNKNHPGIHASGHGGKQEQLLLLNLFKPQYFFPVHGQIAMQTKHAQTAIESKILPKENIFILTNGDRLKIQNGIVTPAGRVNVDDIYVDDTNLSGQSLKVINDRNRMSECGVVIITAGIDSKKDELIFNPEITSRGVIDEKKNEQLFNDISLFIKHKLLEYYKGDTKITFNGIKNTIKISAERIFFREKKIQPIIIPIILNKKK